MEEKIVKELMVPLNKELTIGVEQSLSTAIIALGRSISTNGAAGVLVVNSRSKPVGLLTTFEVFEAIGSKELLPSKYYQGWDVSGFTVKPLFWDGLFTQRCKEELKSSIRPWVRGFKEVSVKADETLMSATEIFERSGSKVLIVFENDLPIGLLSSDSIINEMCLVVSSTPTDYGNKLSC